MKSLGGFISETLQMMNNNEFNKTCNGTCSNCGSCCSNTLPITEKEICIIEKYVRDKNIRDTSINKGTCPFRYEGTKICTIYKIRPQICRQFICDTNQRKPFVGTKDKATIINVRKEFFGGK